MRNEPPAGTLFPGSSAGLSSGRLWIAATGLTLLSILLSPLRDIPQNDDWAYRAAALRFLHEGRFVDLGWSDPTLVFQIVWGGIFVHAFGESYVSLRLSTLAWMPLTLVAACSILRRTGASPGPAAAGAVLLVFNPIVLPPST